MRTPLITSTTKHFCDDIKGPSRYLEYEHLQENDEEIFSSIIVPEKAFRNSNSAN